MHFESFDDYVLTLHIYIHAQFTAIHTIRLKNSKEYKKKYLPQKRYGMIT